MAYLNGKKFLLKANVNIPGANKEEVKELTIANEPFNNKKLNDENNIVGYKGYHMIQGTEILSEDGKTIDIELRDAELEEKAVDYYAVGDLVNIEANTHLYQKQKIVAITPNGLGRGNTVVTLAEVDGGNISFQLEPEDELENWLYVVDKYAGEVIPQFSHAVASGINAVAAGYAAFAGGRDNKAYGNYGFAIGRNNIAAYLGMAAGLETKALAIGSEAHGRWTEATGENSVALGQSSKAKGHTSLAIGLATEAEGENSVSLGAKTIAQGNGSIATGTETRAKGKNAVSLGQNTIADGSTSVATGIFTKAYGDYSLALGTQTQTGEEEKQSNDSGMNAIAAGYGSVAKGKNAVALGEFTEANQFCSLSCGHYTKANSGFSAVFGRNSEVNTSCSFAAGYGVKTVEGAPSGQVALGCYNEGRIDTVLEIGNGTSDKPSTAFSVNVDGSITVGKTKITEEQLIKLLKLLD